MEAYFPLVQGPRCGEDLRYWTAGKGFLKWSKARHKWTTLRRLLVKADVPLHMVNGLTTNIIQATMPGYMKIKNKRK